MGRGGEGEGGRREGGEREGRRGDMKRQYRMILQKYKETFYTCTPTKMYVRSGSQI